MYIFMIYKLVIEFRKLLKIENICPFKRVVFSYLEISPPNDRR